MSLPAFPLPLTVLSERERQVCIGMLAGMLPGMKKAKAAMAQSGVDDKVLVHMDAVISSMTPKERERPELMNAKRKKRVYIPKGVLLANITKPLVNSALLWPVLRRVAGRQVTGLEADVDKLGRFQHAHVPLTDPDD